MLKRALWGGGADEEAKQEETKNENVEDVLDRLMPREWLEEMYCFTMGDVELHNLREKNGKQMKECEFMSASVHITSMKIPNQASGDDQKLINIPLVVISNDDVDKEQD